MPFLTVKVEKLDKFLKTINTDYVRKNVKEGIASGTRKLETALEVAALSTYSIKQSQINNVKRKKSISSAQRGRNIVTSGLAYKYLPKPLHTFPIRESTIKAKSRYLIPTGADKRFFKHAKYYAEVVEVAVKRGKFKRVRGGFYRGRASSSKWARIQGGKSSSRPAGIYKRQQTATWIKEPINRAPIKRLYGLSIADMLGKMLESNREVKKAIQDFEIPILERLI